MYIEEHGGDHAWTYEWTVGMVAAKWHPKCVTWSTGLCLISADLHHPVQIGACLGPAVLRAGHDCPQQLCTEQQLEAEVDVSD